MIDIRDDRFDGHVAIDSSQLGRRGLGLGKVGDDVSLVKEDLPLKVVAFDVVAVADAHKAHAGPNQCVCQNRPERSAPY